MPGTTLTIEIMYVSDVITSISKQTDRKCYC